MDGFRRLVPSWVLWEIDSNAFWHGAEKLLVRYQEMVCLERRVRGVCSCHQCEFSDETDLDCVDVRKGFCEHGVGCMAGCLYSFPWEMEDKVVKLFKEKYPD